MNFGVRVDEVRETQYDQWLGMSRKPMPGHKPEGAPKQED